MSFLARALRALAVLSSIYIPDETHLESTMQRLNYGKYSCKDAQAKRFLLSLPWVLPPTL